MTVLERRKNKETEIVPFSSVADKIEALEALTKKLNDALTGSNKRISMLKGTIHLWEVRTIQVEGAIDLAEKNKPEALKSLSILQDQANRYRLGYIKNMTDEESYAQNLNGNISKLRESLSQLKSIGKLSVLDEMLEELTVGTDISENRMSLFDDKEIQHTLFSAQALVDLHTQEEILP